MSQPRKNLKLENFISDTCQTALDGLSVNIFSLATIRRDIAALVANGVTGDDLTTQARAIVQGYHDRDNT